MNLIDTFVIIEVLFVEEATKKCALFNVICA